ncbi:MAG: hypothetical protein WCR20_16680, partial [Verrucomicrobiota bacterium]
MPTSELLKLDNNRRLARPFFSQLLAPAPDAGYADTLVSGAFAVASALFLLSPEDLSPLIGGPSCSHRLSPWEKPTSRRKMGRFD